MYFVSFQNQKNDHTLWRCIKRSKTVNCPATVIQDGDIYREGLKDHTHPAEPGVHIAVKIKAEVCSFLFLNIMYVLSYVKLVKNLFTYKKKYNNT